MAHFKGRRKPTRGRVTYGGHHMEISEKLVKAVEHILFSPEAQDGYVDVLRGLSVLMLNNPNSDAQKAGKLVQELAEVLTDYLAENDEDDEAYQ